MTCARWAMMGFCKEDHAHAAYMHSSCADACEKAALMGEAEAPPFDIWVVLILIGFGFGVTYAVRYAIQKDGSISGTVSKKTLGVEKGVGAGKYNRSAKGEKVRS